MKPRLSNRHAFSLVELMVVMAIIAMLATIAMPEYDTIRDRARSTACMANLRSIGVAVGLYASDNEGKMPYIDNKTNPVYDDPDDVPEGIEPMTMLEAFSPYGLTENTFHCPSDKFYFATQGSSYEWRPFIDGESKFTPKMFTRRGAMSVRSPSRIRIVSDMTPVHFGRQNYLFADGRATMAQR